MLVVTVESFGRAVGGRDVTVDAGAKVFLKRRNFLLNVGANEVGQEEKPGCEHTFNNQGLVFADRCRQCYDACREEYQRTDELVDGIKGRRSVVPGILVDSAPGVLMAGSIEGHIVKF